MEEKIWKEVPNYEGLYSINQFGEVRAEVKTGNVKQKIIRTYVDKNTGYLKYGFRKNNKTTSKSIHKIVALLFVDNPDNKPIVGHENGIKTNCYYKNLVWCTYSENTIHSYANGLQEIKFGNDCHNTVLKDENLPDVIQMCLDGVSNKEIAAKYNVNPTVISKLRNGKSRKNHQLPDIKIKTVEEKFADQIDRIKLLLKNGWSDLRIEKTVGIPRKSKFLQSLKNDIC